MHTQDVSIFRVQACDLGWQIMLAEAGEDRPLSAFPDRWRAVQYARAQAEQMTSRGGLVALPPGGPGQPHWGDPDPVR